MVGVGEQLEMQLHSPCSLSHVILSDLQIAKDLTRAHCSSGVAWVVATFLALITAN